MSVARTEPRLVAYDYSGSTETIEFYHNTVQRVLVQYEPYSVVLWDNRLEVSTPRALKQINRSRDGRGGTRPLVVAQYCVEQQIHGQLILITDGQILPRHVEELDNFLNMNQMHISSLDCFLIQTAEDDKLDATVIAPFIRRFPHKVLMYGLNAHEPVIITSGGGSLDQLLEEIKQINKIADFQTKFDHLFSEIVTKMLGKTEDLRLHNEILALQRRLLCEMKAFPPGFDGSALRQAFAEGNLDLMRRLTGELFHKFISSWTNPTWPPQLFHLLRMCTGNLGAVFSLSALGSRFQANRVHRADVVENFELSAVQVLESEEIPFTCPISYEEESDIVVLIKRPQEGLLAGEAKELTNIIITNPLSALRFPEFCSKFVSHFDHPIALRSMKEAEEAGFPITQSPLTRAPIIGGLFLGASDEHSHATNFTIAHLVAEGKRVGNADLWFMLIWWLIERGHAHHLDSVLPQIRSHLAFRLRNHLGTFTMTNTPYMPITLVPLGIAAWCTLSTIALGASEEQAVHYLKCHADHIEVLESAISLIEYKLPPEAEDLLAKWRMFGEVRTAVLRGDGEMRKWAVRASRNILIIDRTAIRINLFTRIVDEIPIDGEPSDEQIAEALSHLPTWFVKLSSERRRAVARMLEFFDISNIGFRDFDYDVPTINWLYGLQDFTIPEVPICSATCRPYYVDPTKKIVWHEAARGIFGEVHQQIHLHYYFIQCVQKLKVFPTKEEFLLFVFNNIVPKQKTSLPFLIYKFIDIVFRGYKPIIDEMNVHDFISKTVRSERLRSRQVMETRT
jgi:hypothetical protein